MIALLVGVGLLVAAGGGLAAARRRRERRAGALERTLASTRSHGRFDRDLVRDLPEPVRRYLIHAIQPGTPLAASVRLRQTGSIRLSRSGDPLAMEAEEVLAAPHGYVWRARVRRGPLRIRGFDACGDGSAEMRWWLAGLVPVVRAEGAELARAAAGRLVGEAVFVPSVLLPSRGVRWEAAGASSATFVLAAFGEEVSVTLDIGPEGRVRRASFPRWNADPANGPVGYLPFVTEFSEEERTFGGYTIPTRFRSGWRLGEKHEFAFFSADITGAEYR